MSKNPFKLRITPEPDDDLVGWADFHAEVTLDAGGYIPAHFHIAGPDGEFDKSNAEIYKWLSGGVLTLYVREFGNREWRQVLLSECNPAVAILAGWQHGGIVFGEKPLVFRAISRVDHFRPISEGGNVHLLPDSQQPSLILNRMRADRQK